MYTREKIKEFIEKNSIEIQFTIKSEIDSLHTILKPEEKLIGILGGLLKKINNNKGAGYGVVVSTDKRVIFYRKSIIGTVTQEEYPISKISSISYRKGLLYGTISIFSSNNEAVIENCNNSNAKTFSQSLQELVNNFENKKDITSTNNNFSQIEKLFEMKEKGIITEEEFQDQKNKYLKG